MIKRGIETYTAVIANVLVSLILLLFFVNYFFDLDAELLAISAVLAILLAFIFVLRYKQLLLVALSFLIPLSVPFSAGSAQISLPSEPIVVLLAAFFCVKIITGTKLDAKLLSHPITLLILLDLFWLFVSSVFSQMPEVSFKRFVIRMCYYISFYYFYYTMFKENQNQIKKVFTLHIFGFLIPIVYAFVRHAQLGFTTVGSQQISAPFYYDHTIYGACLVFFIPFIIYFFYFAANRKEKLAYGLLLSVFGLATLLSYSRAAWISLMTAFALSVLIKLKIKFKYVFVAALLVFSIGLLNFKSISKVLNESQEISHSNDVSKHLKSISNINTDASNKERINRWKCALRMFSDKPLLGFGPGTYQFYYGQYQRRDDMTRISTYDGTKGHAHSEYLNYLSETGLPGLLIFISLIGVVGVKSIGIYQGTTTAETKNLVLCTIAALTTYFVHAFFNGFLEFDKMAMPVFVSFASIVAIDIQTKA
jgi:putative inorganic carbon (hco3(-)) transporter